MGKIEYDYLTSTENYNVSPSWARFRGRNIRGANVVSEVIYPEDLPVSNGPASILRTERRPDGSTRSFQY